MLNDNFSSIIITNAFLVMLVVISIVQLFFIVNMHIKVKEGSQTEKVLRDEIKEKNIVIERLRVAIKSLRVEKSDDEMEL